MKKLITLLFFAFVLTASTQVNAQYCGSSQVSLPSCGIQQNFGFGNIDSFKCITRGQYDSLVIPFMVYHQFTLNSTTTATIYKLRFDRIDSLPCGLCWSTSQSAGTGNGPNEFAPYESACLKIAGTTFDAAGSYKLSMLLGVRINSTTTTGYDIDTIASDAGHVVIWIKVIDPAGSCPMTIDTAHPKHPSTSCPTGITEVSGSFNNLNIQPNPMSNEATVSFSSEISGPEQIMITNIIGTEVYKANIFVKQGSNQATIKKNDLPEGIYILTIGGSQGSVSRKFIISE